MASFEFKDSDAQAAVTTQEMVNGVAVTKIHQVISIEKANAMLQEWIEKLPSVYSSCEQSERVSRFNLGNEHSITDTWRTNYHDVSNARFRAKLLNIEEIQ